MVPMWCGMDCLGDISVLKCVLEEETRAGCMIYGNASDEASLNFHRLSFG